MVIPSHFVYKYRVCSGKKKCVDHLPGNVWYVVNPFLTVHSFKASVCKLAAYNYCIVSCFVEGSFLHEC